MQPNLTDPQCLPILVSLETSSDPYLADRALDLHATLHQKHATLVNVRYLDYVKASYEYQRSLTSEPSGHREGQALLSGWFAMLGEKRQYRLDFLKALGRVFNYDTAKTSEVSWHE
jgi:cohesin loading factor subunit SCC2